MSDRPPETTQPSEPPDDDQAEQLDPGSQSLADALSISFRVLKLLMAVIVGIWLFSGFHRIKEDENAIVLRFGKVVGEGEDRIRGPGFLASLPFPIDEVRIIPAKQDRSTSVGDKVTYFRASDRGKKENRAGAGKPRQSLKPTVDGYTLTGDGYILHSDWVISWQIHDPYRFLETVYSEPTVEGTLDVEVAKKLLENELCKAVISVTGQYTIMDAIKDKQGQIISDVKARFIKLVDDMDIGVVITNLSLDKGGMVVSPIVQPAFNQVLAAEQQRRASFDRAQGYYTQVLSKAAGSKELGEKIYAAVMRKRALAAKGGPELAQAEAELSRLLREEASGEAAQRLLDAQVFKRRLIQSARRDALQIFRLAADFQKTPGIFVDRLWTSMVQDVLANPLIDIYVVQRDLEELRVTVNPDVEARAEQQKAKQARKREEQAEALRRGERLY